MSRNRSEFVANVALDAARTRIPAGWGVPSRCQRRRPGLIARVLARFI